MKAIIFGATGMVGQGVLRECLSSAQVESVLAVGRREIGTRHPKLRELLHQDMLDFEPVAEQLRAYDACFYCLGVSSFRMSESEYTRVTYDIAMAAARVLARLNPDMTFVFISGEGADSSEQGRVTWARIKGKTENALLKLPFKAVYVIRPGAIQPLNGVRSRTAIYNAIYALAWPLFSLLRWAAPQLVTTTRELGRAMTALAEHGSRKHVLTNSDLAGIAGRSSHGHVIDAGR